MNWSDIPQANPISMSGICLFMERWSRGSTKGFKAASAAQIVALAEYYGGPAALPLVYHRFLTVMGESTGDLALTWGTTSVTALLDDLEARDRERPDPSRFLKFAIGEDDYNERHPDDFFDLGFRTSDGADARILRVHERYLARGEAARVRHPFATFSDLLREIVVVKSAFPIKDTSPKYFDLGRRGAVLEKAYALLLKLGFTANELGASLHTVPLENHERGAIALLVGPTDLNSCLQVRARDDAEEHRLVELIADHHAELMRP